MPLIHLVLEYCKADLLPIEESKVYQDILQAHGEEVAAEFVYEVYVPPLEDGRRLGCVGPDCRFYPYDH